MLRTLTAFTLSMLLAFTTIEAQAQREFDNQSRAEASGTRRYLSQIIFSGLAGAILGLSTLSFYGRPQDKLSNIAVGAAIGVIGGTMFTTYKAATEPRDFYGLRDEGAPDLWAMQASQRMDPLMDTPRATFTFDF